MSRTQIFTLGMFGDGSDGDVTISGSTTLTRDMYYNTLTVTSTGTLFLNGYGIVCKRYVFVQPGGVIHNDGFDAVDEFTSGSPHNQSRWHGAQNAGGAADNPFDGVGSSSLVYKMFGTGTGGAGGGTSFGAGGQPGFPFGNLASSGGQKLIQSIVGYIGTPIIPARSQTVMNCASGGGSGAGNGVDYGGNSAGAGGGPVVIITPYLRGGGKLRSNGGIGQQAPSSGTGEIGGGGGGGGGSVFVASINSNWLEEFTPQLELNGGSLGPGENGGLDGNDGTVGETYSLSMVRP